ncbi:MAG: cytochrome C oxidase subunit IV family protein, partial [Pseudomonadota bacterium]
LMQTSEPNKSELLKRGVLVFVGLAVLTGVEFYASRVPGSALVLLAVIGVGKAALILEYFMHLGKVFSE